MQKVVIIELARVETERLAADAKAKKDVEESKQRGDKIQQQAALQSRRAVLVNQIMELEKLTSIKSNR